MCSFDCTLVSNPGVAPCAQCNPLFWPANRGRLLLLFETVADKVIARGIDPDVIERAAIFYTEMQPDQKDRFIAAVTAGCEPEPIPSAQVRNENQKRDAGAPLQARATALTAVQPADSGPSGDAIVITDTTGDGHGPNLRLPLPSPSSAALATGTQG